MKVKEKESEMEAIQRFDQLKASGRSTREAVEALINELQTYDKIKEFAEALRGRGYMVHFWKAILGIAAFSCSVEPFKAQSEEWVRNYTQSLRQKMDARFDGAMTHEELMEWIRNHRPDRPPRSPINYDTFTITIRFTRR